MRKMLIYPESSGTPVLLSEGLADNEAQLQELVKDNPDLLPVDEFGMAGPLLVVGRETSLPSGAVDLLAIARGGEILVVEFKTGPQNGDFRSALAQLLDYGSDLWQMGYDVFSSTVAARYFASPRCQDQRVRGKASLDDAVRGFWSDLSDEEFAQFRDTVERALQRGAFHYVVVAQRFTPTMERSLEYLNAALAEACAYSVELVKFSGGSLAAFGSRAIVRPPRLTASSRSGPTTGEVTFLESVPDSEYREALRELFELCRGLGLQLDWGVNGVSIRVHIPGRAEPLSVAWVFPPGVTGWYGLSELTLGYDESSARTAARAESALDAYRQQVAALPGATAVTTRSLRAFHLAPADAIPTRHQIAEAIAALVAGISNLPD